MNGYSLFLHISNVIEANLDKIGVKNDNREAFLEPFLVFALLHFLYEVKRHDIDINKIDLEDAGSIAAVFDTIQECHEKDQLPTHQVQQIYNQDLRGAHVVFSGVNNVASIPIDRIQPSGSGLFIGTQLLQAESVGSIPRGDLRTRTDLPQVLDPELIPPEDLSNDEIDHVSTYVDLPASQKQNRRFRYSFIIFLVLFVCGCGIFSLIPSFSSTGGRSFLERISFLEKVVDGGSRDSRVREHFLQENRVQNVIPESAKEYSKKEKSPQLPDELKRGAKKRRKFKRKKYPQNIEDTLW